MKEKLDKLNEMENWSKTIQISAIVLGLALVAISSITLAVTLGGDTNDNFLNDRIVKLAIPELASSINKNLDIENIIQHARNITKHVHIAGTPNNLRVAEYIRDQMISQGLKNVHFNEYEVLLNYPNFKEPNKLEILDSNGDVVYETSGLSEPLIKSEQNEIEGKIQWLAYSAPGEASGDVVYVNKATHQDYDILKNSGINVTGKIHIARHGTAFRGNIARNAEKNGAIGLIIYSDPAIVASLGTQKANVFPNTNKMPGSDVERGGLYIGLGDPQTPDLPSIKNLYRSKSIQELGEDHIIPNIPVIPLPYEHIANIFEKMNGDQPVDSTFVGKLNATYKYGPGLKNKEKVRINVKSEFSKRKIQNVFGFIEGEVEKDRYVIVSNHYDAWTYGAIDPNSGTSTLLDVSKSFKQYQNSTGWKPFRSILFAHWDAEEFGLIGSSEFTQEYRVQLMRRAVGVINMDIIGGNKTLNVFANPSIVNVIRNAAKRVEHPLKSEHIGGSKNIYNVWRRTKPSKNPLLIDPEYMRPAGGSDHAPFYDYLGVPIITFITSDESMLTYPLYHTIYETKFLAENIQDRDSYKTHKAIGELFIDMTVQLSENEILPYDIHELVSEIYSDDIPSIFTALQENQSNLDKNYNIPSEQAVFLNSTAFDLLNFIESRKNNEYSTVFDKITENNHLIEFEKCFILPQGQNGNLNARHLLYHPNSENWYHNKGLQQIFATITQIKKSTNNIEKLAHELAQEIAQITNALICAKHSLNYLYD